MKGFLNRFTALTLVCTLVVTSLSVSSFATDYQSKYNFWNWAYDNSWFLGKLIIGSADNVCSVSEDTLHHSTNHQKGDTVDGEQQYTCICDDCGQTFSAVATDLENSFNSPNYRVLSDGRTIIPGSFRATQYYSNKCTAIIADVYDNGTGYTVTVNCSRNSTNPHMVNLYFDFLAPSDCSLGVDMVMACIPFNATEYKNIGSSVISGSTTVVSISASTAAFPVLFNVVGGTAYSLVSAKMEATSGALTQNLVFDVPYIYTHSIDVDVNTLPVSGGGSISYTDDNSNNKIYDAEFMDFSTNEYHNPVTDYSTKVDNWEYDYSTRTYTGYTENGEVKIVYGDENITVVEGGNTYNYYYASPSSGGGGSGSDDGSSGDDEGLFGQLGELLGTLLGGLIDLITGVLSNVMDNLIALVTMTIEKLGSIVNLFGSFGDALRSLWSWLPDDIITILSAGVSVVIFACVIKLFI